VFARIFKLGEISSTQVRVRERKVTAFEKVFAFLKVKRLFNSHNMMSPKIEKQAKKLKANERILIAAEQAFAKQGFERPSLRDITAAAKVNLASVSYYFGSRDGLVDAVMIRAAKRWNAARIEQLDNCEREAGGVPVALDKIVACLVDPILDEAKNSVDCGGYLGSLLGRSMTDPSSRLPNEVGPAYAEVMRRFDEALSRSAPHLERREIFWRLFFGVGGMLRVFTQGELLNPASGGRSGEPDWEWIRCQLIKFITGGIEAESVK